MKLLSAKYDNEKVVVTMDFSPSLATGESLTGSPVITITTNSGVDATPEALLNGAAQISSSQVLIPITGGLKNCSYLIKAVCTTSNSNKKLEVAAILPIYPQ